MLEINLVGQSGGCTDDVGLRYRCSYRCLYWSFFRSWVQRVPLGSLDPVMIMTLSLEMVKLVLSNSSLNPALVNWMIKIKELHTIAVNICTRHASSGSPGKFNNSVWGD